MKLDGIRVLIWDFDGTLYKPDEALFHAVREAEYKTIQDHTGWEREKVEIEFAKLYKTVYPSATEATAVLSGISIPEAAVAMEKYFDRRTYLGRDEQLVDMFKKLKGFRHFILANGVIAHHKETLPVLGIPIETFEEIVTSEIVGVNKPHPDGFLYILKKTGLPASQHLMIGDRPRVDLEPAKKLGMRTCLVWSDDKDPSADIVLSKVYDLPASLV